MPSRSSITEFDLEKRREWALVRASALQQWEEVRGALETDEKAALEALEVAQRNARELVSAAMEKWQDITAKRQRAQAERDAVVGPAEAQLRATCSSKVREFADRLERRYPVTTRLSTDASAELDVETLCRHPDTLWRLDQKIDRLEHGS